jgi:hypothetical protein
MDILSYGNIRTGSVYRTGFIPTLALLEMAYRTRIKIGRRGKGALRWGIIPPTKSLLL